ncbi:MAG: transporter [Nitrospirae bacterium]|nr:transporter [Nitrospirota bacterium]
MYRYILSSLCGMFIIAGITFVPNHVNAGCGSANCFLVTGTQEGITAPGQIILDLSYRFIPMDRAQRGSERVSEVLVPGINFAGGEIELDHHREKRTINELAQMDVSYGVTNRFALSLALPVINDRLHEHFVEVGTPEEAFSRQDGTAGFGDLRLVGKYALWVNTRHLLVGGLGVKAPTGDYKLLDSYGTINEPTIMPGTGSWDGLVSAFYNHQLLRRLDAFLSASYQMTTENNLEYQFGNTLLINGGINHLLILKEKELTVSLQINMRQAPHDEFKGEQVPGTGGIWIYLTPGVKVPSSPNTTFYTHVQLPVYQYVNETNLVPRYGLIFGMSHAF